jgi:hypothetical protein
MPERNIVTMLDDKGLYDRLGRVDHDVPARVVMKQSVCLFKRQGMGGFTAEIHAKLLKNLRAQHSTAGIPELRVCQNVGIDEEFIAHEVLRVNEEASSRDQTLCGAVLRRAFENRRIPCSAARFPQEL